MSAKKHSPGPWKIIPKEKIDGSMAVCRIQSNDIGNPVCIIESKVESSENARLIAAAPDLLEALEELKMVYLFNQSKGQAKNNHINETLVKVDAAIKKAK